MVTTTLVVENPRGLHARSATAIVNLGRQFNAAVTFEKTGQIANGNNIMELLLLVAMVLIGIILTGRCLGSGFFGISANCGSLNIAKISRSTHVKQHFSMENYENRIWGFKDQSNTQIRKV